MTEKTTRNIGSSEVKIVESEIYKTENLPFPYVHYPSQYGIFFGFSLNREEPLHFCECSIPAIKNYIQFVGKLFPMDFPPAFNRSNNLVTLEDLKYFRFEKKICHRCNLSTPYFRYCHEMYGSKFKQFHGWYINQTYLRLGINYRGNRLEYNEFCPSEIIELIEESKKLFKELEPFQEEYRKYNTLLMEMIGYKNNPNIETIKNKCSIAWEKQQPISKKLGKINRKIHKIVENECRLEFGYRKIGEGWVSETQLYNIVKKIFPNETIIRHYRPDWLEKLELDIYIPDLKIAFEYQGQQHYHPIKAWGGEKSLKELKERDEKKKELCYSNSIKLIEVDYSEPLTEEHIRKRLELLLK